VLFLDFACVKAVWREAKDRFREEDAWGVASAATLLLSGDAYSAWNARKRTARKRPETLDHELAFSAVVLRRHPKAGSAWSHRRWLLEQRARCDLDAEFALCETLADRYPRNSFAWTHRTWVAARLHDPRREIDFARTWLRSHVTDYSAAHYATDLLADSSSRRVRLRDDTSLLRDLDALHADLCDAFPHLAARPAGALAYFHRTLHKIAALSSSEDDLTSVLRPLRHRRCELWLKQDTAAVFPP